MWIPDKVSAILNYSTPRNTTKIKRLICHEIYSSFINDFSSISSPINNWLHYKKQGQAIVWTSEDDIAFSETKSRLTAATILDGSI